MNILYESSEGVSTSIWIDATITAAHGATATPTENPIERGASTTDHIQDNADTLTLECVVTNVPHVVPQSNMDGVTGSVQTVELRNGGKANVLSFSGDFDRVRSVDAEIRLIKAQRKLVQIVGLNLRDYQNMAIVGYNPREDVNTAKSLSFTLELKNIFVVDSEVVDVPDPEEARGHNEESRGSVPTEEVPRRSFARGLERLATGR